MVTSILYNGLILLLLCFTGIFVESIDKTIVSIAFFKLKLVSETCSRTYGYQSQVSLLFLNEPRLNA